MHTNQKFKQWASAHVFYNMINYKSERQSGSFAYEEQQWRQMLLDESPNGTLLVNNSFFDSLQNDKKVYLAHTTTSLEKILNNKYLYPSGGCLVGAIYCTPVTKTKTGLRMHNLGSYIAKTEASLLAPHKKVSTLLFEIEMEKNSNSNLIGIDYLRLGEIHYLMYQELEYLLSSRERFDLHNILIRRVRKSINFLNLCMTYYHDKSNTNKTLFFEHFIKAIDNLPILGYFYFEAISEYIMYFQDNDKSQAYKELGEFYNLSYKNMMYSMHPRLKKNFKLSSFQPSIDDVISYLKSKKIFTEFDSQHLANYVLERIVFLVQARLIGSKEYFDWCEVELTFDILSERAQPLIGHLLHRELRSFGRYPHFYFYFDQYKALQIWNYWNHMDIAVPFNAVIPKGEVGINPAFSDLKYKVYDTQILEKDGFTYLKPSALLDVKAEPRLVNLRHSVMRNKDGSPAHL